MAHQDRPATGRLYDFQRAESVSHAIDLLEAHYESAVKALSESLAAFLNDGTPPDPSLRATGAFTYPELRFSYAPDGLVPRLPRAYAKINDPGVYAVSVTRPGARRAYLTEQLELLQRDFPGDVSVGPSSQEIPYSYVLDQAHDLPLDKADAAEIGLYFPAPDLAKIGDEVPDGQWITPKGAPRPLALFDALRTDWSLSRLAHYTGTPWAHVQQYVLFTNYQRYVDEFVRFGVAALQAPGSRYHQLSACGGILADRDTTDAVERIANAPWRKYQMPSYHLMAENGAGITLINIGVGPSNAKNITDHLAVLRPHCWLMIGHCGGLRASQRIGDYVLAHAYLRHDAVLDHVLPRDIPIPAIAEVQLTLQRAAADITGETGDALKARLRTGTVMTKVDRNWELRYEAEALTINQSRAAAVDMESATIAANGYRMRVPYGTLLCVSDKPLHGEIKLPGAANRFYERAISEHLKIGIRAVEMIEAEGPHKLHSRKLRSFDEPPFR